MAVAMHRDESFAQRLRDGREELRELKDEAAGIAGDAGKVAREEVRLAVTEVREGVRAAVRTTVWGAAALGMGVVTLMWLPLPVFFGLNTALEAWLAALLTVAILGAITLVLALVALKQLRAVKLVPREAMSRMKEDSQWLKQQLSREPN